MNLRYDALPGEWQDDEPVVTEAWPDEPDTHTYREVRPMRACCVCGATTDLEPTGGRTYGCIDWRACERRFDALLAKTHTARTAQLPGMIVQAA